MKKIYLFVPILLLSSCASRQQKAANFFRQNPNQLAEVCADLFPIRERVIPGALITKTDTTTLAGIILPCPPADGEKTVFISCPGTKKVTQVTTRTDTVIKENTARIAELSGRLFNTAHDYEKYKTRSKHLTLILMIAAAALGLYVLATKLLMR